MSNRAFTVNTKHLEMERFYQSFRIPQSELGEFAKAHYKVHQDYDIDFGQVRISLETLILKEPLGHSTETRYYDVDIPANWWQHLKTQWKDDFVTRWLLRHWPVKYKTRSVRAEFRIEHAAIYPEANIAMPALGRAIPYHTIKELT